MDSLLANEPRRVLAPLQVNTAVSYNTTALQSGENAVRAKLKKSKELRRSFKKTSEKHDPPAESSRNVSAAATPSYPALRTVLHATAHPSAEAKDTSAIPSQENGAEKKVIRDGADTPEVKDAAASGAGHLPVDVSHVVSVHPPSSAKPRTPSRRPSMTRLRQEQQQQQLQRQQQFSAGEKEGEKEGAEAGAVTPTRAIETNLSCLEEAVTFNFPSAGVQVFSYRPTLSSPPPQSSSLVLSSTSDALNRRQDTPEKQFSKQHTAESGRSTTAATATADVASSSAKVLPKELRSPSGVTEMGIGPYNTDNATSSGNNNNNNSDLGSSGDGGWGVHTSLQMPGPPPPPQAMSRLSGKRAAEALPPAAAAAALSNAMSEVSAPFHALQFVLPSSHDHFMSPPHSGCSEACDGDGTTEQSPALVPDNVASARGTNQDDAKAYARLRSQQQQQLVPRNVTDDGGVIPHVTDGGAASSERVAVLYSDELFVCPFALLGCCPRGTHTAAELQHNSTLHQHLVAVASCVKRMKARQQQLEQTVVLLQHQVHMQARALQQTTAQLERAQQQRKREKEVRGDAVHVAHKPSSIGGVDTTRKALPGDVSLHESQVTDYGVGDEEDDDDGDHGELDEGVYARQLRQRTQSAKQLYVLRDNPEQRDNGCYGCDTKATASAGTACGATTVTTTAAAAVSTHMQPRSSSAETHTCRSETSAGARRGSSGGQDTAGTRRNSQRKEKANPAVAAATRHNTYVGPSAYLYDIQRGACGSTEVSGMSNVPSYQLPNESVSTISSASSDLDDREDDTEVGEMQQQLLCLSAEAATAVESLSRNAAAADADKTEKNNNYNYNINSNRDDEILYDEKQVATRGQRSHHAAEAHSARSTPSLASTTYRPSQLAHVSVVPLNSDLLLSEVTAGTVSPSSSASDRAAGRDRAQVGSVNVAREGAAPQPDVVTAAPEGVRHAVPLQRPTLIRKADVVPLDKLHSKTPLILPRTTTPNPNAATTTAAAAAAAVAVVRSSATAVQSQRGSAARPRMPTVSIMSNAATLKPRRLSAPDSEGRRVTAINFNDVSTANHTELTTTPANAVDSADLHEPLSSAKQVNEEWASGDVDVSSRRGIQSATPAVSSVLSRRESSPAARKHRCQVKSTTNEYNENRSAIVAPHKRSPGVGEQDDKEREGGTSRRSSLSRSRREAAGALRRPQHATSMLSTKEAEELGEVVLLGRPPCRQEEQ